MRKALLVILFLLFVNISLFAGIVVNSSSANYLDLTIDIPDVEFFQKEYRDGNTYSGLNVPQSGKLEIGKPDVPGFARWILIPNGTTVNITAYKGEATVYNNINIPPVQPNPSNNVNVPAPAFTKDEKVYSTNANYPGVFAETEPIRNKRGQSLTIIWLFPYQYNPVQKTLSVYPDLEVSVSFSGMI